MYNKPRPAEKFLSQLESASSYLRGCTMTAEEYDKIKELFKAIDRNVLIPASMHDRYKDNDE